MLRTGYLLPQAVADQYRALVALGALGMVRVGEATLPAPLPIVSWPLLS